MNVNIDFDKQIYRLPINPNIIYRKFGWKNWNDFLSLDNEMSIRRIRLIIYKENENRIKKLINPIDTKETYIEFVNDNLHLELPLIIDVENGNWIKFCLKNYDELVKDHYTIEQLKNIFTKYKISNKEQYIKLSKLDNKFIKYEFISNGFYNDSKYGFNINDIYYIEKHKIRRY
jgi:hypothetical protein